MADAGKLPTSSDAQNIGARAEKCFGALCPESWRLDNLGGTGDFGIDYLVQTFENNQASDTFKVQLKGTMSPALNADGSLFSIQLKASTIRYYARFTEAILLVLSDLSANSVAIKCPLYYVWIHDELRRLNVRDLPDEQLYLNLHVPKANVLDGDTDLSKDLSQFRALANIGTSLDMTLEAREPALDSGARAALLEKLPSGFSARSAALIESLAETPATVWPDRPINSMAWLLHEAERNLNIGAFAKADEALHSASEKLDKAVQLEVAEYWHLKGRAYVASLSHKDACASFEKALAVEPDHPKYIAAWAETKLSIAFSEDGLADVKDIYPRLTSQDPGVQALKARILAAEKRYEEAEEVLASFSGAEQLSARALVHTMQSKSKEVLLDCDVGLALPNIKDSTRLLFVILKARAQFSLAVGVDTENKEERIIVPVTGTPTTDHSLLHEAWLGMETAIEGLRATGWPANIEFVADIISATAPILRKESQALAMLSDAAEKRPSLQALQTAVEMLAAQTENFDLALRANARLPQNSETKLRKVLQLHMGHRDAECVSLFEAELPNFDRASQVFAQALTAATSSAHRLVKTDLVKSWLELFNGSPELIQQRAVWEYYSAVAKNPAKRPEALDTLFGIFESGSKAPSLAIHLFHELSPHVAREAEKLICVAEALTQDRQLPLNEILQLGQALATLERWSELLELAREAQKRFSGDHVLVAVASLALDRLGRTADARSSLIPLVVGGTTEPFILGTYIDIATRCGFTEEAVAVAETLVSVTTDPKKKIHHLKLLHNLVRVKSPKDPRAYDIAWRIGELTNPDDEISEGTFLMMVMMSSHPEKPDPAQIVEYQERLQNYIAKFPTSPVFRSATVSDNATPDEFLASILALTGDTIEGLEAKRRKQEEEDAKQRHIPFSWRPTISANVARDLPQLWKMSKKAHGAEWNLLLSVVQGQWTAMPWEEMRGRVPLMDLLSLLLAHDLKILDLIFKLFAKVAISQRSMFELGRLADPLSGSPGRSKCHDIQATLKRHFGQILQPRANKSDVEDGRDIEMIAISAEMKTFSRQNPYLLYSDDAYFRIYCQEADQNFRSICVLDILAALERRRLLTTREVAKRVGMLCSWGVSISLQQSWQIAILPGGLGKIKDIDTGLKLLRSSKLCIAMFDGMWDRNGATYNDLLAHAGNLAATMICDKHQTPLSIASLMTLWHSKAMRLPGAPPNSLASLAFLARTAAAILSHTRATFATSLRLWQTYFLLAEHDRSQPLDDEGFVDAVAMLAAAIANHDLNVKGFGQRYLKRFFDSGLKDGSAQQLVLNTSYKWWWKSFMDERGLSHSCQGYYERTSKQRPDFWLHWQKNDNGITLSWHALSAVIDDVERGILSSLERHPLEKASYQQAWPLAKDHVVTRWARWPTPNVP